MQHPLRNLLTALLIMLVWLSCKKESFTTSKDAILVTSADTLHFDTVFTSTGSTVQQIKIFNNNPDGIHIGAIQLAGGNSSPFRINVNGRPGPSVAGVDIAGGDSAYVFVTVSINPSNTNLPFLVSDSIELDYNGNRQWVQLQAYGRNAHFLHYRLIRTDEVWTADLPYVITGSLVVDSNATLKIEKGCRVYIHADAPFVVTGSLQVTGAKEDSARVLFTGDRLDEPYSSYPAGFPGLTFAASSHDNSMQFAIIRNAYQGIVVNGSSNGTKLTLHETVIDNAYDAGLLCTNAGVTATNMLISNCGSNMVLRGGNYSFTHCTLAAYSNSFVTHKNPALQISNADNGATYNMTAQFVNCIIWGESGYIVPNEAVVDQQGNNPFAVTFTNVLLKSQDQPAHCSLSSVLLNQDPLFDSVNTQRQWYSFRLKQGSPAIDKGINTGTSIDLDGNPRPVGLPDLGAYEKQ